MPFILRLLLLTIIGQQHRALTLHFALMRAERGYYRGLVPTGTKLTFSPAWRRTFGVLSRLHAARYLLGWQYVGSVGLVWGWKR